MNATSGEASPLANGKSSAPAVSSLHRRGPIALASTSIMLVWTTTARPARTCPRRA